MLTYKELDRYGDPLVLDKALKREVHGYPDDVGCESVADAVGEGYAAINVDADDAVVDKACALLLCHTSDAPWTDIIVFEKVVDALSGFEPDHTKLEGSTAEQMAMATCVMRSLRPKMKFNDKVIHYIRGVMQEEGIVCYPKCLDFAQEEYMTDDLRKLCKQVSDKVNSRANTEGVTYNMDSDDPLEVQLAKLSLVQEYVNGVLGPKKVGK